MIRLLQGHLLMSVDFDIRQFLRRAPRDWLHRYFDHLGVLADFDWDSLKVRDISPLHEAWLDLDEDIQQRTVADFRNLALLGTPMGKVAIIDEASFHPGMTDVATRFGELEDPLACAFWTYFERPKLWDGAVFFAAADAKGKRYWRTRANIPTLGRKPTNKDARALGSAVGDVFKALEGRGRHCEVHSYRRRDTEYFFAYPQDHRQTSNEYDQTGRWTKRPYNPAFEIIFVLDDAAHTLTIWHQGSADRVKDLQVAFVKSVIGRDIPRDSPKDNRVYELDVFLDPDFILKPPKGSGIKAVDLRRIRINVFGHAKHTHVVNLAADTPPHVLHQRVSAAIGDLPPSLIRVTKVGFRAEFDLAADGTQPKPRDFDITWPNSTTLEQDDADASLWRLLHTNDIILKTLSPDAADHDNDV